MPAGECPDCSLPLIPGSRDGRPPRCPNCGPVTATARTPAPTPARSGRRRDSYDDEYEPRDRRRDRYDEDYRRRFVRRDGVPWYAILVGAFMLCAGALALLGHGAIFCYGFFEEFLNNREPEPEGLIALAVLAAVIVTSLVAIVAGYSVIVGRRYWLGIVGCVAVALATHLFVLGAAVGIAALIVLLQAEVKESFR